MRKRQRALQAEVTRNVVLCVGGHALEQIGWRYFATSGPCRSMPFVKSQAPSRLVSASLKRDGPILRAETDFRYETCKAQFLGLLGCRRFEAMSPLVAYRYNYVTEAILEG
jgi:hypothetical protein